MKQNIVLVDSRRNEIGTLEMKDNGTLEINVLPNYAHLEPELKHIGECIHQQGEFSLKKAIQKDELILETEEKLKKNQEGYLNAVANFINRSNLTKPRIFAIVKSISGGED